MKYTNKIKIFVVDTNLLYLSLYELSLRKQGHNNIITFANGNDCIKAISFEKPDVIFIDESIIYMYGSDLLKQIKSIDPNIHIVLTIDPVKIKTDADTFGFYVFDYIFKGEDEISKAESILLKISKLSDSVNKTSLKTCL